MAGYQQNPLYPSSSTGAFGQTPRMGMAQGPGDVGSVATIPFPHMNNPKFSRTDMAVVRMKDYPYDYMFGFGRIEFLDMSRFLDHDSYIDRSLKDGNGIVFLHKEPFDEFSVRNKMLSSSYYMTYAPQIMFMQIPSSNSPEEVIHYYGNVASTKGIDVYPNYPLNQNITISSPPSPTVSGFY